jgi:CBS domain-containing protein
MPGKSSAVRRAAVQSSLTAKDIMEQSVLAATPRASLRDVAIQLVNNEISGMPVAADDGRVIGVITEADIVRALLEGKRPENLTASDVMTGPPITVDQNTSLADVMKSLEDNRIVRVPVTNDNTIIGIIARRDIIKAVLEPEFLTFGGL